MNVLFDGLTSHADLDAVFARIPSSEGEWTLNYGEMLSLSGQFSNALVHLGVRHGDRVAVQVSKSIEALMLYLATIRIGAVFLPLNTAYTPNEIEYFLKDAAPALFVCKPDDETAYCDLCQGLSIRLKSLGVSPGGLSGQPSGSLAQLAAGLSTTFETVNRDKNDLAAILYTSGTTGRSKGAMLTHENLLSNARSLVEYWKFSRSDVLIHALPIFHTHGLFVASNVILLSGASMIFLPGFDADRIFESLPSATCMMGVPTFYTRLLDDTRLDRARVDHMRLFVSGSAPLLAETHMQFEARTGHRILERYGMTETNMNTSNPYEGERRAGTVGFPLPDVAVRITEAESGKLLGQGEVGLVEVKGPNVFSGYWNMPEKTKEEFTDDGFFITGDLGLIDDRGYLSIVGRAKDLIISGGYNIYPKELELLLDDEFGVLESAVIGVPHRDFGEGVVGIVVPECDARLSETVLIESLRNRLARFKLPKRIVFLEALPRNTMGKVQKNILRERYDKLLSE